MSALPPILSAPARTQPRGLAPAGPTHPCARRYSLARRNLLPRDEAVVAVQGRWAHDYLLTAEASIDALLWCPADPGAEPGPVVAELASRARTSYRISERCLARIHPGLAAPQMLSLVRLRQWSLDQLLTPAARLILVADGIEYAGNLGTLVRSVDASGADGIILTSPVARLTHAKVFTASRGTVLTTPTLVSEFVDVVAAALIKAGFTVVVADPDAEVAYGNVAFPTGRAAIVVGSEGNGVSDRWRDQALTRVGIPMSGKADSLNVAVSASILLFDARHRLGIPP